MKPAAFEYRAPRSLEETLSLLAEHGEDARLLAGGQSLVPLLNFRMVRPAVLIDLNRCTGLDGIAMDDGAIVMGTMVRQGAAERSAVVHQHCPLLVQTLGYMGHQTIRNRGTVGGSLAHADPSAELPAAATALSAQFVLVKAGERRVLGPDEFFVDSLVTALEPDEMLSEIRFPVRQAGDRFVFLQSGVRRADLAIAGVAVHARLDAAGVCTTAQLAALGGGTRPIRLTSVESAVTGEKASAVDIEAAAQAARADIDPPADLQASADYRRDLIVALTAQALRHVLEVEAVQ